MTEICIFAWRWLGGEKAAQLLKMRAAAATIGEEEKQGGGCHHVSQIVISSNQCVLHGLGKARV